MSAESLDVSRLWTLTTPDSVLQAIIRPPQPAGWELCVLQDDDLEVCESFVDEEEAREYVEALRERPMPALGASAPEARRAG